MVIYFIFPYLSEQRHSLTNLFFFNVQGGEGVIAALVRSSFLKSARTLLVSAKVCYLHLEEESGESGETSYKMVK